MAKHVAAGERVRKSAAEYNSFLDAAEWVSANIFNRGGTPDRSFADADKVWIQNDTGAAREQFDVLELGDVLIKDGSNAVDGNLQILFSGDTPSNNVRHTAVLCQGLGSGSVGVAWISGVHPATVSVGNVLHRRASAADGSHSLASDMIGPYQILNALSGTGSQTCVVRKSNRASIKLLGVTGSGGIAAATWSSGASGCACNTLTPGSGTVTLLLWDEASETYQKSTVTMTVYNIADAIGGCKDISFSTDDDGCPTVDVEPCTLSCV